MATSTLGSNSTSALPTALKYLPGLGSGMSAADIATVNQAIRDDLNRTILSRGGQFDAGGILTIPNRGILQVRAGDWVAVDSRGWPILLSADTIANGLWTHTP
jgi:hypothetical protein